MVMKSVIGDFISMNYIKQNKLQSFYSNVTAHLFLKNGKWMEEELYT